MTTTEAQEHGKKAFHAGIKSAPALDKSFCDKFLPIVNELSHKDRCAIWDAWQLGWQTENINMAVN